MSSFESPTPSSPAAAPSSTAHPSELTAQHFLIRGQVQGVYYRASMVREADRLGVTGWVRNRADGRVEACAWGTPAALAALHSWAQRGPENARVDAVVVGNVPDIGTPPAGFVQRETV